MPCCKQNLQFTHRKYLLFFLGLFLSTLSFAQQTVTGRVVDSATAQGLPNINVSVRGTGRGTITNASGNFSIAAAQGDVLELSAVNYLPQEVVVGSGSLANIVMTGRNAQLNEVVVIGYGQRRRKDVTGAVASVTSSEIEKSTFASPELAMQGRMAGVLVSTPSGNPNDRVSILIRGVNSFNSPTQPLFVVDGIPIQDPAEGTRQAVINDLRTPQNIFNIIDPNDIESISVLKDASAAAIYGVRAANGVILITTKRGRSGKPRVELNAYYGIQNTTAKKPALLNTQQFVNLYKEAYAANPNMSSGNPVPFGNVFGPKFDEASSEYLGNSPTYDWYDQYLNKNAPLKNISVKLSGASEALNYYTSLGYYKTEGTLKGSDLERYNFAVNLTSKVSKYVEAGLTARIVHTNSLNETSGDLSSAMSVMPWQPIFDPAGPGGYAPSSYAEFERNPDFDPNKIEPGQIKRFKPGFPVLLWGPQTKFNPFGTMAVNENRYQINEGIGNAYLQITPVKGLRLRGSIGGTYSTNENNNIALLESYVFSQTPGNPYSRDSNIVANRNIRFLTNTNLLKEATATYTASLFNNHNIELVAGVSDQTWDMQIKSMGGYLYYTEPNLQFTPELPLQNRGGVRDLKKYSLLGYFGRLSYRFADKYYVDATLRRDGSSRFAPNNRWGTFPAIALGWRITSEKFFPTQNFRWLNDLKLRGGWGKLGNDLGTEGFAYLSLLNPGISSPDYSTGSGNGNAVGTQQFGAYFPGFPNTALGWETLVTSGAGFDATMFNNKVNFTFEYYNKTTEDIIQSVQLPLSSGIQGTTDINVGKVRNTGIEMQLGFNQKVGPVNLSFSGNFTTQKNRVVRLNGGAPYADNIREGFPIGYIRGYKMGGIFQTQAEIDAWRERYTDMTAGGGAFQQKPGDVYFQDVYGNPSKPGESWSETPDSIINDNDRTYLGKSIPGYFYGFNANASFRGLDLSLFFQGVGDVQRYNWQRAGGESMSSNGAGQWATTLDRWTPQNPSSTMPRAIYGDPNANNRFSDRFVEDAGFLRLKNIQLGYSVPKQVLGSLGFIDGLRVYVSGVNLLTATKWKGLDPENDVFPPAKQFLFGLNANF